MPTPFIIYLSLMLCFYPREFAFLFDPAYISLGNVTDIRCLLNYSKKVNSRRKK